jgi:hypothetical protein
MRIGINRMLTFRKIWLIVSLSAGTEVALGLGFVDITPASFPFRLFVIAGTPAAFRFRQTICVNGAKP